MTAFGFDQIPWTAEEDARLVAMYPAAPWPDLLKAFPGRTRNGIYRRANAALKLKRGLISRSRVSSGDGLIDGLRQRRIALGYTQTEVASILGFSFAFVERCERGDDNPSYFALKAWCQALGLELGVRISRTHKARIPKRKLKPVKKMYQDYDRTDSVRWAVWRVEKKPKSAYPSRSESRV